MEWIIGSNIATFILTWFVARLVVKKSLLEEQAQIEIKRKNTEVWMDFIKSQGGQS